MAFTTFRWGCRAAGTFRRCPDAGRDGISVAGCVVGLHILYWSVCDIDGLAVLAPMLHVGSVAMSPIVYVPLSGQVG